jgi:hypothetical protein
MEEEVLLFGEAKAEETTFQTGMLIVIKLQIEEIHPIPELAIPKVQDLMAKETTLPSEITKVLEIKLFNQEETKLQVEVNLLKAVEIRNQARVLAEEVLHLLCRLVEVDPWVVAPLEVVVPVVEAVEEEVNLLKIKNTI